MNRSKQEQSLADWVEEKQINTQLQLIPAQVSLDIKDFKTFVEKRRELLKKLLIEMVGGLTYNGLHIKHIMKYPIKLILKRNRIIYLNKK